ncbi:MAG: RES family NAD+ phosphorylase [Gammaproteobacteria bacterium]|nr:RES family NAD+ phosphorylase [Gammaproteobacteria bacterium]
MSEIWDRCRGPEQIHPIAGELFRFVESQEQVATNQLVDSLQEQAILEELLEGNKPPERGGCENLHYLLKTLFRYPPLPWGSRFGRRFEPSLFYGSLELPTALAETAYYRLLFYHSMETPPPSKLLRTEHSSFKVSYQTASGIQLQHPPFDNHREQLRHVSDYAVTQSLGNAMRESGVEAFEFFSARCEEGLNVALFVPAALGEQQPRELTHWLCETSGEHVAFKRAVGGVVNFSLEQFAVNGSLPGAV